MKVKFLFFSALALSILGILLIFIKLNYYFWQSKGDFMLYAGMAMLILAMLITCITFVLTTKELLQTSKMDWLWCTNLILMVVYLIAFLYYLFV